MLRAARLGLLGPAEPHEIEEAPAGVRGFFSIRMCKSGAADDGGSSGGSSCQTHKYQLIPATLVPVFEGQEMQKGRRLADLRPTTGNGPTGVATWDAVLIREVSQTNDACQAKLAEITSRLREKFDLSE